MTDRTQEAHVDASPVLIWEDADDKTWWLARSHDEHAVYVIAEDAITHHILVLRQTSKVEDFKVVAAVPQAAGVGLEVAIADGKRVAAVWHEHPDDSSARSGVRRWRLHRLSKVALREVPLACVALIAGSVLAFIVAAFFIMTSLAGWIMIVVGTAFGAGAGWLLKWLADQKVKSALGPMGRFLTISGSATLGALCTTSLFFVLFGA